MASPGREIPRYDDLVSRLHRANMRACVLLVIEILAIILFSALVDWQRVGQEWIVSLVACGGVLSPMLMGVMMLWAQKKKEIGDLKESTRFGQFDKHTLRALFRDTLSRLKLPPMDLPVYITADKSLNAASVRLGLGGVFKSLNGIYLNRQVLHRLTPEEVQDVMGHELGHYYRYYLYSERFQPVTLTLGSMAGLFVIQKLDLNSYVEGLASICFPWLFWILAGVPRKRYGKSIEFLCDHLGAQIHGIETSISGLLKIGADAELQFAIHEQFLLTDEFAGKLSSAEIISGIEAAIPFGHTDPQSLRNSIEHELKKRDQFRTQTNVSGFLKYAWEGEEDKEETLAQLRAMSAVLDRIPRLNWEAVLKNPTEIRLDRESLEQLIDLIKAYPNETLFRSQDIISDSHPPLKQRILFLWENRDTL